MFPVKIRKTTMAIEPEQELLHYRLIEKSG